MLLWLIIGFLLGIGAILLRHNPDIKLAWYDWLMLVVASVFFILAIANYNGSMEELEPRAANVLLASFGLPGVILTAIVGVRVWRSYQMDAAKAPKVEAAPETPEVEAAT